MTRPDLTLINVILDRSGSMGHLQDATIAGFNEFLKGQANAPGEAQISLIQFDNVYQIDYLALNIKAAPLLTRDTYQPRGGTALFDAIGRTIIETGKTLAVMPENERPGKVLVVIDTDGHENASREFDKHKINDLITEHTDKWKWEFIFLGANQDAILTAAAMGIKSGNAINTKATVDGMGPKFSAVSAYSTRSRRYGASGQSMSNNFTDEERAANS